MNTWEFQAWLGNELGMTRVSLQGQGEGKFTGSGMKDRKLYQIKVTRDAHKARWEIEHIEPGTVQTRAGSVSW
jgi:hypothetical protein